ncbi:MAG: transporter, partial [Roseobacter sp.]|nr:transporter [Roseobacter sp.]
YFLGSRDTLAGIVPPPGTYLSFSYDYLKGDVQGLSLGGLPIRADAEIELNLIRLGFTTAFDTTIWGATPAINVVLPIPDISLDYTAVTAPLAGRSIDDDVFGVGDISVTGLLGWHSGNLHYSTALTVYMPTGSYETASIDVPNREIEALSLSKNVWSFQPAFAATWLNPQTGFEVSGAASLLFSTKNSATDYQTAPALQLEAAVVQRLRSGWGFGVTGYHYQQLDDDSGRGASQTRAALGARSLKARVSGVGPLVTYSGGTLFGADLSVKLKYVNEFEARRRLESDVFTAVVSLAF